MYSRMLVPLDGSTLAEGVLPYARELSRRLKLHVVFIHVLDKKEEQVNSDAQSVFRPHV